MNFENIIESQYRRLDDDGLIQISSEFSVLYRNEIKHSNLKIILSSLHEQYINLFKVMNTRLPTSDDTAHFWADPSRQLITIIEVTEELSKKLKGFEYSFEVDTYYLETIEKCKSFLSNSGGSTILPNMEKIDLYYKIPIFSLASKVKIRRQSSDFHAKLKLIGEGSYATVFKYKDSFYNNFFALKRAKEELNEKELKRFKLEFSEMKKLSSPYIVKAYRYIDIQNEYLMEYMDCTLDNYILENNNTITELSRLKIALQILRAFKYLASKNILHRDISPRNILIKKYDDTLVVKVSDFGLIKTPESNLTSLSSELRGCFNDPKLQITGFANYNIIHETFALTRLLYFVMTGKRDLSKLTNSKLGTFVKKGISDEVNRFQTIEEIHEAFRSCF